LKGKMEMVEKRTQATLLCDRRMNPDSYGNGKNFKCCRQRDLPVGNGKLMIVRQGHDAAACQLR
jgi:hypothetical protein